MRFPLWASKQLLSHTCVDWIKLINWVFKPSISSLIFDSFIYQSQKMFLKTYYIQIFKCFFISQLICALNIFEAVLLSTYKG